MMLAPLTTERKLDCYDVRHVEMLQSDLARFRVTLAELEGSGSLCVRYVLPRLRAFFLMRAQVPFGSDAVGSCGAGCCCP